MKKVQKVLTVLLCVVLGLFVFTACDNGNKDDGKLTVTFLDATGTNSPAEMATIKTVKVDKNGTVERIAAPEKAGGYEFVDWFATPSKSHRFDFSEPITKNISVYGGYTKFQADTRTYYIAGSGTSELLFSSNWGKVMNDTHKLAKAEGKNEYTITCDLKTGDEFTFVTGTDWANKRGFGYVVNPKDGDVEYFGGQGSVYDDSAKGSNIKVLRDGNYTLTLKTYPADDYYNTSGDGYTEERKDIYNIGTYDTIEWKRNGDVVASEIAITDFYIKGAGITSWKDMFNADTQMARANDVYTLSVYLKANEEFMFTSRVTKIADGESVTSAGSEFIKSNLLDAEGQKLIDGYSETGGNMKAKAAGTYTFTYNKTTGKLAVTFDATKTPAAMDYYIDGDAVAAKWNEFVEKPADYKLAETAAGTGIYTITKTLAADKQFQLRACKAGETPTTSNTADHLYQIGHLAPNSAFEAMGASNANIKVLTAGTYDITFDSYSKIITITTHTDSADTLDIYIKGLNFKNAAGTAGSWSHDFKAEWLFALSEDELTYEFTITVETEAAEFGLEKHPDGETTGYGEFLNSGKLGTAGDANALFGSKDDPKNFKCSTAGTYKIVYTIATGTVDIYKVTA